MTKRRSGSAKRERFVTSRVTDSCATSFVLPSGTLSGGDGGDGVGGSTPAELQAVGSVYSFTDAGSHEAVVQLTGEGSVTHTSPATGFLPDWEAESSPIAENSAPWYGTRVVDNLCLAQEDLTNAAWTDLLTTTTATTLIATAANASCLQTVTASESDFVFTAYITRLTGEGLIDLTLDGGTTWIEIYPTDTERRFYIYGTDVTDPEFGVRIVNSGDSIRFTKCQLENTAGRADTKTATEYVTARTIHTNALGNITLATRASATPPTDPEPPTPPEGPDIPLGDAVMYYTSDFETAGAQGFLNNSANPVDGWGNQTTIKDPADGTVGFVLDNTQSRNGSWCGLFRLTKSDWFPSPYPNLRPRCQLLKSLTDYPVEMEKEYWLGGSLRLGDTWGDNPNTTAATQAVLMEIHGSYGPPSFSLVYGTNIEDGVLTKQSMRARFRWGDDTQVLEPRGATTIVSIPSDDVPKNTWMDIVFRYRPSHGDTGICQMWLDGVYMGGVTNTRTTHYGAGGPNPNYKLAQMLTLYYSKYDDSIEIDPTPYYELRWDEWRVAVGTGGYYLVAPSEYS